MTIEELDEMMKKLKFPLHEVITKTKFDDYNNLSEIENFEKITIPDELQLIDEYRDALFYIQKAYDIIEFISRPVGKESRLHRNFNGNYECSFHTFHCGDTIEFYYYDEYFERYKWAISRVEHDGKDYYIVNHKDLKMNGLVVRNRRRFYDFA